LNCVEKKKSVIPSRQNKAKTQAGVATGGFGRLRKKKKKTVNKKRPRCSVGHESARLPVWKKKKRANGPTQANEVDQKKNYGATALGGGGGKAGEATNEGGGKRNWVKQLKGWGCRKGKVL